MWYNLGKFILKFRLALLVFLALATAFMIYKAKDVKMSYEFTRAIPTDNVKYQDYQSFLKKFGADGSTLVIGIESDKFYSKDFFNKVGELYQQLKKVNSVENVLAIPEAIVLNKDSVTQQLVPQKIFHYPYNKQAALDSAKAVFENLPFYQSLLYSKDSAAYLIAVSFNKDSINSKSRTRLVNDVMAAVHQFEKDENIQLHVSGLPFIRTTIGDRIKHEMNYFLIGSFLLSAIVLFIFFRSISAMLLSLVVVAIGVIFCIGTMVLCHYKITLLTAMIPSLIVVIGIPNCIYFLNKYHTSFKQENNKNAALVSMIGRMGIVTLFCNIAAAIGFAVFAFTSSQLLKEFGVVAGINVMALFFISLIFIPAVLSYLPQPKPRHVRYLDNKFLENILLRIETWTFHHAKTIYSITIIIVAFAVIGIFKLKKETFIVDDLPKSDKIYTDLKWFEQNFNGVMPLEIMIDAQKNRRALSMETMQNIEELSNYIASKKEATRPLTIVEALKFANQAYYDNDSGSYRLPMQIPSSLLTMLRKKQNDTLKKENDTLTSTKSRSIQDNSSPLTKILRSFVDSTQRFTRISVNMKDIGSVQLPILLNDFENKSKQIFDTTYKVTFTGSSVTFLEGSSFIINGLKESICWAFGLIALCMLFLFKSFRILLCSILPNLIPLIITAGIMGWAGISLKPSTVLVFSVALGIVIDVTIRFLINYRQELPNHNGEVEPTVKQTIHHTGISIIYTSLVLIAGFVIFCFSGFGGTKALGWLTSLTLIVGTITNLVLLPLFLLTFRKKIHI